MKKSVRILLTRVIPAIFLVTFALLLLLYVFGIRFREGEQAEHTLVDLVSEQKNRFNLRIEGDFSALGIFSDMITLADDPSSPELQQRMWRMVETTDFAQFRVLDASDAVVLQSGQWSPAAGQAMLARVRNEETALQLFDASGQESGDAALLLAVPVRQNGQITGALIGMLDDTVLSDLLSANDAETYQTALCDAEGNLLAGETTLRTGRSYGNLFSQIEDFDQNAHRRAIETVRSGFKNGELGSADLGDAKKHCYIAFAPLNWNGWFLCTSSCAKPTGINFYTLDRDGYELLIIAMISALLFALLIILLYRNAMRTSRKEREWLVNAEEEYRISARQGGMVVARFDIDSGALLSSQGAMEQLQLPLDSVGFNSYHAFESLVTSESKQDFQAFWNLIREGRSNGQAEIGMKSIDGAIRWFAFEFAAIGDGGGTNVQAIVTIRDVTNLHERMAAFKQWQNVMQASIGKYAALIEINLTTGVFEQLEGELLEYADPEDGVCRAEALLARFGQRAMEPGERERFFRFSSLARLRELAEQGTQKDEIEIVLSREDGASRLCLLSAQMAFFPQTEEVKAFLTFKDLEDFRFEMDRLSNLALYDELSGLLNRTAARSAIEEALRYGSGERVALFMIDADNFKLVNDTLGHQHGDLALVQISQAIKSVFRASDIIARIGGDEFFVFLSEVPGEEFAESKASALCSALRTTYSVEEHGAVVLSASIGVVIAKRDKTDYDELYAEADRALYDAKNAGKNRYSIRRTEQAGDSKTRQPRMSGSMFPMESLMQHLDGGVILLEIGERLAPLFISEGYFSLRGVMETAISDGTYPEAIIHPSDFSQLDAALNACANDGEPFQISYRNVLPDGGFGWRHMNAIRVPSVREGKPVVLAVISDITELHNAMEHLEMLAARSQIGIFIIRVGERLEITFFNDGALAITGFTYEQMRLFSRDASAFFRGGNLKLFREEVRAATAENRMVDYLYQSYGFHGKNAHKTHLYGVRLDVQNGVPSYLILMVEHDDTLAPIVPPDGKTKDTIDAHG